MTKVFGFISFTCPEQDDASYLSLGENQKPELFAADGKLEIHFHCPCCKREHWVDLHQMLLGVVG